MRDGDLHAIPVEKLMEMIQKSVLFGALGREGRLILLERGKAQIFDPGEAIVLEGEPGDSFYLIVDGRVEVYSVSDGSRIDLAVIEAGNFFGEMSVLQGTPRSATCGALLETTLISFDKTIIGAILRKFPDAREHILRTMVEREEDNYAKSLDHLLGFDLSDDEEPGDDEPEDDGGEMDIF